MNGKIYVQLQEWWICARDLLNLICSPAIVVDTVHNIQAQASVNHGWMKVDGLHQGRIALRMKQCISL